MSDPRPETVKKGVEPILVLVRLYAMLRGYLPGVPLGRSTEVPLPAGASIGELLDRLGIPPESARSCFVNGRKQELDYELSDGDEVAVFPPVAGGSPEIR